VHETPDRFVKVLEYNASGCSEDPATVLTKTFAIGTYDEMVRISDIRICTTCAHHGERILGLAHFAYIPATHVVGLSKIPRMISTLCRRPQVQEQLTTEIVDIFMRVVKPSGCAVHLKCLHLCMLARGVEEPMAATETTALRGVFQTGEPRQEFLLGLDHTSPCFPW
jgi:GTP cyclohydrolase I